MYIHGAGILMLTFGVYWWDPCYIMLPYIAAPLGSWDLPSCRSLVQCRDAAVLQESGQLVGLVSDTMGFFHGNSPTKSSLVGGIDLPLWKKGKSAGMIIIHYISLYIYIHHRLVGGIPTPLKNDGVRQWEGWHPIYEMKNNPNVPNHQSDPSETVTCYWKPGDLGIPHLKNPMCGEQTCLQMTIAVHVEVPEDGDEDVVLLGLVPKWHRNRSCDTATKWVSWGEKKTDRGCPKMGNRPKLVQTWNLHEKIWGTYYNMWIHDV